MTQKRKIHLLAHAESRAQKRGLRWTDMRSWVYARLLDGDRPLTAYQLLADLSRIHKRDIKPASVYRALEALVELELIVRIESLTAFRACHHPEEQHQHVFLVCNSCGTTAEMEDEAIGKRLTADAATHGFRTGRQVLELHGECRGCQH